MRRILIIMAIALLTGSAAQAQPASGPPALETSLSLDQKIRISEIITNAERHPLSDVKFPFALNSIVPQDIQLHALPPDAEQITPQVRGLNYLMVDELIGLIEPQSRKIVAIFQRWRRQQAQ